MAQLFTEIGPMLLQYKNANAFGRRAMILDAMITLEKLSGKLEDLFISIDPIL